MDILPIELVTLIATDTFDLFITLLRVPTIGVRLCADYPQMIAKKKFIIIGTGIFGSTYTYLNDKLHSFNDKPACVHLNGELSWYKYGKRHRGGGLPTLILNDGTKMWYWKGKLHRNDNLPAIEYASGVKIWYNHGTNYHDPSHIWKFVNE